MPCKYKYKFQQQQQLQHQQQHQQHNNTTTTQQLQLNSYSSTTSTTSSPSSTTSCYNDVLASLLVLFRILYYQCILGNKDTELMPGTNFGGDFRELYDG